MRIHAANLLLFRQALLRTVGLEDSEPKFVSESFVDNFPIKIIFADH